MKRLCIALISVIIIAAAWFGWKGFAMYRDAIQEMDLETKVASIREKPEYTQLSELPEIYRQAVVDVEDKRFYHHGGFDIWATMRAVWHDLLDMSFAEGGSTITQQLAKNLYFTQDKTIQRKVAEVFMAFKIENTYSKDEILELYVNSIYFGSGYTSVREASQGYFQKDPAQLTDQEATLLAGIPNAPSVYSLDENPDLAYQRQRQVVNRMVELGDLSEEEAAAIVAP